jgi:hypothetical protein
MSFSEFVKHFKLEKYLKDKEVVTALTAMEITPDTPITKIFDRYLS